MTDETRPTATAWRDGLIANCLPDLLSFDGANILRYSCEFRWDGEDVLVVGIDTLLGQGGYEQVKTFLAASRARWPTVLERLNFEWWDRQPLVIIEAHNTDLGNAQRLVAGHGADLRYCHPWRRWLVWDGQRWRIDDTAEVTRRAKDTVRGIYSEAAGAADEKERKALAKHAMASEAHIRIKAMIALAESEPGVPVLPDALDADPWLLTVANGTLDLRSGELLAHDPELFSTKLVEVEYDPAADCPLWLRFLQEILSGDDGTIRFLQRAIGYSLTGDTSERCLFVLYGCGANGKTTFLEVIRALLGDYALRTPTETLMLKRPGSIPNDVARLRGARFVSASESEEGRRLAESLIKDLTGRDTISARFMRAEWFDFVPECKIWLATNHKPEIRGTDKAIWDRIRLIPFEVTIPEDKQDKQLADKLKEELPGILAWAVEGCLAWQREGLGVTEKVRAATRAYRDEMDILAGFIEDCCIEGADKEALAGDLHQAYKDWGGDLGQRKFGLALKERGFTKGRKTTEPHKGRVLWRGLGLLVNLNDKVNLSEPDSHIAACFKNSIGDI